MKKERWVAIPTLKGSHEISTHGRFRTLNRTIIQKGNNNEMISRQLKGRILRLSRNHCGYDFCHTSLKSKTFVMFAHKWVAKVFVDNPDRHNEVNHIDGDKRNNYYENLEWVSHRDNMKHAARTGLCKGRENSRTLEWEDACEIRALYAEGSLSQIDLATEFSISQPHVNNIINWRTWLEDPEQGKTSELSMPEARLIRKMFSEGTTMAELSNIFKCTQAKLVNVVKNRTFKDNIS